MSGLLLWRLFGLFALAFCMFTLTVGIATDDTLLLVVGAVTVTVNLVALGELLADRDSR